MKTIAPNSNLPAITGALIINGYSQPGSSPNMLSTGKNAVPLIQLSGASLPGTTNTGLAVLGSDTTIRGLVVNGMAVPAGSGQTIALMSLASNVKSDRFAAGFPPYRVKGSNFLARRANGVLHHDKPNIPLSAA